MTRADLKHCGKIPDAREELNRSVREGRIESRHSIKSLEGMGSSSHDLGAELRMHSFTVNCDTFSMKKVAGYLFSRQKRPTTSRNTCVIMSYVKIAMRTLAISMLPFCII